MGYAIYDAVLSATEIHALLQGITAQTIPYSRAGARHVLKYVPIANLAADARLISIASSWLDAPALPFKATLFDKNPEANWLVAWHQDTALPLVRQNAVPGWGPWSTKDGVTYAHAPATALDRVIALRIHLDDSSSKNGSLRVLPGTHRLGILTDVQVGEIARCTSPYECCVSAGAVMAMRPLIIHSSSKSVSPKPRRVLHIEYAASMEIAPGLQLQAA